MCPACEMKKILETAKAIIQAVQLFDSYGNPVNLEEYEGLELRGYDFALVEATQVKQDRRERRHVLTIWQGFGSVVAHGPKGNADLGAPRVFETAIVTEYSDARMPDIDIQGRAPNVIAARAAHDQIVELAKSRRYKAPRR